MTDGWFRVSRGLTDARHDLHPQATGEEACRLGAWVDLLGYARYAPGGGIKRGEMVAGERFLASRWNWSKARVHRFLDELESAGRIRKIPQSGPRKPNRIMICNYESYQEPRTTSETTSETTNETKEEEVQEEVTTPKKKRARRLPESWDPTESHRERAGAAGLDLGREVAKFRVHAKANDRRQVCWNSAFTNWLMRAEEWKSDGKRRGRQADNGRASSTGGGKEGGIASGQGSFRIEGADDHRSA